MCLFPFWLAGGAHGGRRDSHGVVWCLMDGYEVFVDIYSCDRPKLVSRRSRR